MLNKSTLIGGGFARGEHSERAARHSVQMRAARKVGVLRKGSRLAKKVMAAVRAHKKAK